MPETPQKRLNSESLFATIFRRGLTRTMLFWFLALALAPLTFVSYLSYENARLSLHAAAVNNLKSVARVKSEYIHYYFKRVLNDLENQAEGVHNAEFLLRLESALKTKDQTPGKFVKSFQWEILVEKYANDLKSFVNAYGYHDALLIDTKGNILYSIKRESDLGANLFSEKYAESRFAVACEKTLKTGKTSFSDLELYEPSDNALTGFIVSLLLNEEGDKIGLIALQLNFNTIDRIISDDSGLGRTGKTYLVGEDLKLRGSMNETNENFKLIDTKQTRLWNNEHSKKNENGKIIEKEKEKVVLYTGPNGKQVLGVHDDLEIAGVHWAIIAEIDKSEAFASADKLKRIVLSMLCSMAFLVFLIAVGMSRKIVSPLRSLVSATQMIEQGDYNIELNVSSKNEIGDVAVAVNQMAESLHKSDEADKARLWLKQGREELGDWMRSEHDIEVLAREIITYTGKYIDAMIGAFYIADKDGVLKLFGKYGFSAGEDGKDAFSPGEGLVGQAAIEKKTKIVDNAPENYIKVASGLGEKAPSTIIIYPLLHENNVKGVIELAWFGPVPEKARAFLDEIHEPVAVGIHVAQSRTETDILLDQTQCQAKELQEQQEELRAANEELEEKTESLEQSERDLLERQEELRASNEELEEKTERLEKQSKIIEDANLKLSNAQSKLEERARELETSSRYKSEFLANMSHELRSPLNSLLILSKIMADNEDGNLSDSQVESAQIINKSGNDLLTLINDILDLSKIEAGKMELHVQPVAIAQIASELKDKYGHVFEQKELSLEIEISEDLPECINTDAQRVEQVLKNFLSNSAKFTHEGGVTIQFTTVGDETSLSSKNLLVKDTIALSVTDTGIGISPDKLAAIFEAFQQADGSTSRQYGGTGLGLSISRELARILEGEIQVSSEPGKGSIFTLFIPLAHSQSSNKPNVDSISLKSNDGHLGFDSPGFYETASEKGKVNSKPIKRAQTPPDNEKDTSESTLEELPEYDLLPDDRENISSDSASVLIVEDDKTFAGLLMKMARKSDFQCLVTQYGRTALKLASALQPSAIILDMGLPDIDGGIVLSELKSSSKTKHIPVQVISARDEDADIRRKGAIGYLTKPISPERLDSLFGEFENIVSKNKHRVLLIEDDAVNRGLVEKLIKDKNVEVVSTGLGEEACELISKQKFDCLILDLELPDISGFEVLRRLDEDEEVKVPPIIIFTARDLSKKERDLLDKYENRVISKGIDSPSRLLDETTLFLHSVASSLPGEKQMASPQFHETESVLDGRKILMVDDDMRNLFALTKVLQGYGLKVEAAADGVRALEILDKQEDIELVLMDIMMPKMDGYEAIRRIRKNKNIAKLPVVALTAKAMPEDRQKCLDAGADDYLTKPVDIEKLMSLLRVLLHK